MKKPPQPTDPRPPKGGTTPPKGSDPTEPIEPTKPPKNSKPEIEVVYPPDSFVQAIKNSEKYEIDSKHLMTFIRNLDVKGVAFPERMEYNPIANDLHAAILTKQDKIQGPEQWFEKDNVYVHDPQHGLFFKITLAEYHSKILNEVYIYDIELAKKLFTI